MVRAASPPSRQAMLPLARHAATLGTAVLMAVVCVGPAGGQEPTAADSGGRGFDGPAPPVAPASIARDAQGRVTMRAVRLTQPFVFDGRLDDPAYVETQPAGDFIQQEPREGERATERTEVWVFFDDRHLYVGGRLWDSQPERIVANEMRRDSRGIFLNDNFGVAIDTYFNKRTGFFFQVNPLAGLRDALVADEGQTTYDWDGVWDARTARFEGGWTIEVAIPFKTLRFAGAGAQLWGINFRRMVRWKNETAVLSPVPASYGNSGVARFSRAATLVGVETPATRNLDIKPYVFSDVLTDREVQPIVSGDLSAKAGVDVKYGLTPSLTADFTLNTDFAQVETDEQQVNLTRFSLFFPEKREFFLEGQGIFEFAGLGRGTGGGGGGGLEVENAPILFFSRRIGLEDRRTVPILAGGRVSGRAGPYALGALNIQTRADERVGLGATNFSVLRLRRDVLRRSNIGVLATRRAATSRRPGWNEAYGVDANLAFFQDVQVNGYYARTRTPAAGDDQASYFGSFKYDADRYGLELQHLKVGRDFNPEIGFLRREDFRETLAGVRFSPRPRSLPAVRKFSFEASLDYITNLDRLLETRTQKGTFETQFQSSDISKIEYGDTYELLPQPFEIAENVVLPVGSYDFREATASLELGPHRRLSGELTVARGSFFGGDRTAAGYSGRVEISPRVSVEPRVQINWVDLPQGRFTARLVGSRTTFTLSPRMFVGALVQYNSSAGAFTGNVRFRWEYRPGSDIFVVFSEGRDAFSAVPRGLLNRGFVVKVTRLFRM